MGLSVSEGSEELKKAIAKELSIDDPNNAEKIIASYYGTESPTKEGETQEEQDEDSERNE